MANKIKRIRSGGQTGVDRAALDVARKYHIEICGWCPKGGWVCFVNKDSSKSEGKFPIYGLGIPHFRKETYC